MGIKTVEMELASPRLDITRPISLRVEVALEEHKIVTYDTPLGPGTRKVLIATDLEIYNTNGNIITDKFKTKFPTSYKALLELIDNDPRRFA